MAIPAASVIRKVFYKSEIIIGLLLYAIGALLTIPASLLMDFNIYLIGFYVLTFGLAFLETTANPYILSMGPRKNATQRLILARRRRAHASQPRALIEGEGMTISGQALESVRVSFFGRY